MTTTSEQFATSLNLDHQLCFAVYSASHAFSRLYTVLLEDFGLTYTQFLVLLVLWERDGLTVKELGARLHLDSGTLTPVLRRLEHQGHVHRERDRADRRRVNVYLTEAGRCLHPHIVEARRTVVELIGLSADELHALRNRLEAIDLCLARATEQLDAAEDVGVRRR